MICVVILLNMSLFKFRADACNDWYITYYTDKFCTTVHNVARTDNYTDCRPAGSLLVTNLVSVRGKCSTTPAVSVRASSYIIR